MPDLHDALTAVLDHWLARGVDGFRLDVATAYIHDTTLTDNPAVPMEQRTAFQWGHAPNLQFHYHDSNMPEDLEALDEIRRTVEHYPDRFVMGEFSEEAEHCGCYAAPDKGLHSGYSFPLLDARRLGPAFVRDYYDVLARYPHFWPSIAFSNHDVMRTVSRFGGKEPPEGLAKLMLALLFSLRGTALLYQGEELGLPQAKVTREQIRDPVGDLYYPYIYGRDGCRTPMPWDLGARNMGFTEGTPWLPLSEAHGPLAVSHQASDPNSTLTFARAFLVARKENAALRLGDIEFLDAPEPVLAFTRTHGEDCILCLFNMSGEEAAFGDARLVAGASLNIGCGTVRVDQKGVVLGPYAAEFVRF